VETFTTQNWNKLSFKFIILTMTSTPTPNEKKDGEIEERTWNDELEIDYQRILSVGEECITPTELKALLLRKGRGTTDPNIKFNLYDGFEPSGRMHIAQGKRRDGIVKKNFIIEKNNNSRDLIVRDKKRSDRSRSEIRSFEIERERERER
jgi:hypothetical protein